VFQYCGDCGLKESDNRHVYDDEFIKEHYPENWKAIEEDRKKIPGYSTAEKGSEYIRPDTTRGLNPPSTDDLDFEWFD